MEGRRSIRVALGAVSCVAALAAAGCGGGERQDADEPSGRFNLDVVQASFPARQQISDRVAMRIRVRNRGSKTAPNVALTVKTQGRKPGSAPSAFGQAVDDARLADNDRPVWILDKGPDGGSTAYTNTWALGPLRPGQSKEFAWRVTSVQPGTYRIDYETSPGLDGKARLASGSKGTGSFRVRIDGRPPDARVGDKGQVIREPAGSAGSGGTAADDNR